MTITPYTPVAFPVPVASAGAGGAGVVYPYVSNSEFAAWPTALDVQNLVPGGDALAQARALAAVLRQASAWADQLCLGQDASAKGASLCATVTVEQDKVRSVNGVLRLVCSYKPVIAVLGCDIGFDAGGLSPVGATIASQIRVGIRTIFVPLFPYLSRDNNFVLPPSSVFSGDYVAAWSYVNGYPHTELAANIVAGATSCTVLPTDGKSGLLGIVPGFTRMTVVDGERTESFTVRSVSGTTIETVSPFASAHKVPNAPDFLPVTAVPPSVRTAAIYFAMTLIKTRGDGSIVLEEMAEPKQMMDTTGNQTGDIQLAIHLLQPYMVRMKPGRR